MVSMLGCSHCPLSRHHLQPRAPGLRTALSPLGSLRNDPWDSIGAIMMSSIVSCVSSQFCNFLGFGLLTFLKQNKTRMLMKDGCGLLAANQLIIGQVLYDEIMKLTGMNMGEPFDDNISSDIISPPSCF